MPAMRKIEKKLKDSGEPYWAWVFNPDESRNYSDFKYVNEQMSKLAEYFSALEPERLREYLDRGQHDSDFADFTIQELGREHDR